MTPRTPLLLAVLAAAALALRSAGTPAVAPPAPVLSPNYAASLKERYAWRSFPVTVAFQRDENDTRDREDAALDGFDHWVRATQGFATYTVVADPRRADIVVRFDPSTNNGYTQTRFWHGRAEHAEMSVGVERDEPGDTEAVAAHELGHALGIDGHSDDRRDLMYPVHWAGTPARITERDLNTLATRYPALARRLAAERAARRTTEWRRTAVVVMATKG